MEYKAVMIITDECERQYIMSLIDNAPLGTNIDITAPGMTAKQRGALHVWCEQTAELLNNHGLDMRVILSHRPEIPWCKDSVKHYIWKPCLKSLKNKDSTEDQTTIDPTEVLQALSIFFSQKMQVILPEWPSLR